MILELVLAITGIIIFFLVGIVASYLFFPKCGTVERIVYSIILSVSLVTIACYFLYILGIRDQFILTAVISLILLVFVFVLLRKKNNNPGLYKTFYNNDFFLIALFSLIGGAWRYWFLKGTINWRGPYEYSGIFKGGSVPDLGFYTGMAEDRANYVGTDILKSFFDYFSINFGALEIFITVFLYLGLIYLLFISFRADKKLAHLGVILMCLGPIEIFYTTLYFYGRPLSYIVLFLLFLFFKSENKKIFWVLLLLAIYSAITYYTATMVVILSSLGFLMALFIKDWLTKKSLPLTIKSIFKNEKAVGFLIIFVIALAYLFFISNMKNFTVGSVSDSSNLGLSTQTLSLAPSEKIKNLEYGSVSSDNLSNYYSFTLYKDPRIFGLSAIGWQSLFFILCGASFILYLIYKKNLDEKNFDLLLCLIPIIIVSAGFFYMNYPARIFDYFAFFGLMALKIPKKYYRTFAIISFVFIISTSICVAKDKKIFFENSEGEITAPKEISTTLNGRIFSDQKFVNNLILKGYYNVTGTDDNNPLLIGLFYSDDKDIFLDSIKVLKEQGIKYIATTKRMREKYILMLNYPKKKLINSVLYEENLQKVYDNGDVKIYSTKIEDLQK